MEQTKIIKGTVRSQVGEPLDGLHVQAFEVSLRNEMLLGEATTACMGHYSIAYTVDKEDCDTRAPVSITVLSPSRQSVLYKTPSDELRFDTGAGRDHRHHAERADGSRENRIRRHRRSHRVPQCARAVGRTAGDGPASRPELAGALAAHPV